MKKIYYIITFIFILIIFIVISFYFNQKPKQDITGNEFNNYYKYKHEIMCCENCLYYGVYEDSKDCLEIIKEYGGLKHCYLIMENYPHTFSECKKLINN